MLNLEPVVQKALANAAKHQHPVVASYSFPFGVLDLLPLLTHPADRTIVRIFWEQPTKKLAYAGLNQIFQFDVSPGQTLTELNREIMPVLEQSVTLSDDPSLGPKVLGGTSFDNKGASNGVWSHFPTGRFIIPECLATRKNNFVWITISLRVEPDQELKQLVKHFNQTITYYRNRLPVTLPPIRRVPVDTFKDVPTRNSYRSIITSVLSALKPGKIEKAVISRSHQVKIDGPVSVISAIQILRQAYPECTSFMFSYPGEGIFFGATPEQLIKKEGQKLHTAALAGTMRRGENMEEDRLLAGDLLDSHKEREEHQLVIDQIRGKMEAVVDNLYVQSHPEVLKLKNVQHLQTQISGDLNQDYSILDLVDQLHPTPAIAGTPTAEALKLIRKLEQHDRGWYSGPIGWMDQDQDGEFCVALRSALIKDNVAHVFAGGGIVSESIPDREWDETELKLQPIISALSGGEV